MATERGQLLFQIDAMTKKLADTAATISACVVQLAEQRDDTRTHLNGLVRYSDLVVRAMGAYLTGIGQFRGKTADEVVDFFKQQISPSLDAMPHLVEEQQELLAATYHVQTVRSKQVEP